ncbi:hypothetical protein GRI97_12470 [Altererythrobacter xixiisoli]|uniref:Lipoprotein n=1 Tax=Croceibacterium xixiisoli TaxID=1476466 RepID=A0A6I4TXJ2_9SPHN|nr:hypothetical protein [Croceibacterium xixiisoli]MXO99801.1 hypothetical protein [Croceibacterium xixiisoli]
MKSAVSLALAILLAGCTQTVPSATHENSTPAPQPAAAGFDQEQRVGRLIVTPLALIEDSRCPINAICVWQGRLILSARVALNRQVDTVRLTLREPKKVHGRTITLETATPNRQSGVVIAPGDYRFGFSGG